MTDLKPSEIVKELDKYIIGQNNAKRFVAIALRNRWRRRNVPENLKDEIAPKNIILIGPTGVGKTEIARRLSKLTQSPFNKVEASKFTEIGYVGRDVESMIRDLMELYKNQFRLEDEDQDKTEFDDLVDEQELVDLKDQNETARGVTDTQEWDAPKENVDHKAANYDFAL